MISTSLQPVRLNTFLMFSGSHHDHADFWRYFCHAFGCAHCDALNGLQELWCDWLITCSCSPGDSQHFGGTCVFFAKVIISIFRSIYTHLHTNTCRHMYVYVYVFVRICICMYLHLYLYLYLYLYKYSYVYLNYVFVCMCLFVCICMYACMHAYMYVCVSKLWDGLF